MAIDPVSLAVTVGLNALSMALTASQTIEGPRLESLDVTTASYGTPLSYFHGVRRFDAVSCIWAEPLREVKRRRKTKGGKYNDYTYYGTWAVVVADQQIDAVTRIWFDRNLVYDTTGAGPISPFNSLGNITDYMRIYLGAADQDVDPRMAATIDAELGAGSTPAYRGVAYIVFQDLPLEKLGNRLPQVTVEAATAGQAVFPYDERTAAFEPFRNFQGFAYSPDGTRAIWHPVSTDQASFEIWDVSGRALMVSGTLDESLGDVFRGLAVGADGSIYVIAEDGAFLDHQLRQYSSDGVGSGINLGPLYGGEAIQALTDGFGYEHILISRYSNLDDGYRCDPGIPPVLLDTSFDTGQSWQIDSYFVDAYGDVWAVGGCGDLAADVCALWRIIDTGVRSGPNTAFVTMPNSQSGAICTAYAYHYRSADGAIDQIIVSWGQPSPYLVAIDINTFAVNHSVALGSVDPYAQPVAFASIQPGAASIWIHNVRYSSADLSVAQTIDFTDWIPTLLAPTVTYDRLNNAMLTRIDDTQFAWLYLDRFTGAGLTLQSIVEDVAARCGLEASDLDASDLDQVVRGYSWTQGSGKQILDPLLEAYDSEARPHNFQIEFLKRGAAGLGTIPVDEMGAGSGDRYKVTRTLDTDLPLSASLTFADLDGDQQPNTALTQRGAGTTDSRRDLSLDLSTWAADADEARQKAVGYLRRQWLQNEAIANSVTRKYQSLEPGDVWALALDDVTRSAKLTRLEFGADGVLTCEWRRYGASIHTPSALPGAPADGFVPSTVSSFGYTKGYVLDIPLVQDSHDALIAYVAAAPYSPDLPWPGATVYQSDDNVDFDIAFAEVASSQAGTLGYATDVLPGALATVWDRASTVTVSMFDGELTSTTEAAVENGANIALLGDELIQFATATLVAANTYQLSDLLRGRRGTEWATSTHATGDRFVLMTPTVRAAMGASDLSVTAYYKPVTSGGAEGFVQTLTYTGASLKPYSPSHLAVEDVAGDLVATWVRRTRIGGAWRDYQDASLGEGSEAYVMQVLDAGGAVIRTYSGLSSPTGTYTAAHQATDGGAGATLRVMQVSATVGNGFPADIAI